MLYPSIVLPVVTSSPEEQGASDELATLPAFAHADAWREVWRLCAPAYFLVASSRVQFKGHAAGVGAVLSCVMAAVAGLLRKEVVLNLSEKGGSDEPDRVGFVFARRDVGQVTLFVDVKEVLDCENYAESVERTCLELVGRSRRPHEDAGGRLDPVWGMLVDAKGSVAFCLDAEADAGTPADPGTPAGSPRGTIACSGYLPIFSCLDAAEGLATWIQLLLGAACPECRQWSVDEWRKRRERYDADAAAFEAHTAHLF
jgi:hypothetical protein